MNYYDISNWLQEPKKYHNYITKKAEQKLKVDLISPIAVDTVKLYALLKSKVSNQPNGFYTFVQQGLPLNNMIWWDFVLESDKGFIHIWRTTHTVEAMLYFEENDFDLKKFIHQNISIYIEDIKKTRELFDKHTVYINHYKSYKDCVEYLWKEINKLDLSLPSSPEKHVIERTIYKDYFSKVKAFSENSVIFHTLGKSLVLNAAFELEAFLNLVIRVGANPELQDYPDILKKHLSSTFSEKLKNTKFYSAILSSNIDLENPAIKDAFELMTLRNKYVHADETSSHNKIGEVFFDNDFPLHPISKDAPAIESIKQVFHRPDFKTVDKSYKTVNNFIIYIESLFKPEYNQGLIFILNQNPIGFNENTKAYSIIYNQQSPDFYLPIKEDSDE